MNKFAFLRVAWLLGKRQIQRSNIWISTLIIVVLMIVFLNLVVVAGLLVGLIEGGNRANRQQYTGDVIVTTRKEETSITKSFEILQTLETYKEIEVVSPRLLSRASVEANYIGRRDFSANADIAGSQLSGIDLEQEDKLSGLRNLVVEGEYLQPGQQGYILIGSTLLRRYSEGFGDEFDSLKDVYPGDRVRVTVGETQKEFIVKGIVDSKVGEVSFRMFLPQEELRRMNSRPGAQVNEIAIRHDGSISDDQLKRRLIATGYGEVAVIKTAKEAIPQFLIDIKTTFAILGNVIGFIGLIVAIITVFIVVYINALTRRRYIGILKAIGVKRSALELAYVMQALFYAIVGSGLSMLVIYFMLIPFFDSHPLDFPFSDGILVAPIEGTLFRLLLLLIVTLLAGFIPAWLISRQNTLDSVLGR